LLLSDDQPFDIEFEAIGSPLGVLDGNKKPVETKTPYVRKDEALEPAQGATPRGALHTPDAYKPAKETPKPQPKPKVKERPPALIASDIARAIEDFDADLPEETESPKAQPVRETGQHDEIRAYLARKKADTETVAPAPVEIKMPSEPARIETDIATPEKKEETVAPIVKTAPAIANASAQTAFAKALTTATTTLDEKETQAETVVEKRGFGAFVLGMFRSLCAFGADFVFVNALVIAFASVAIASFGIERPLFTDHSDLLSLLFSNTLLPRIAALYIFVISAYYLFFGLVARRTLGDMIFGNRPNAASKRKK
jgi:hypothetical protein